MRLNITPSNSGSWCKHLRGCLAGRLTARDRGLTYQDMNEAEQTSVALSDDYRTHIVLYQMRGTLQTHRASYLIRVRAKAASGFEISIAIRDVR